jgi:hypothetical protein
MKRFISNRKPMPVVLLARISRALITIVLVSAAFAISAVAQQQLPFKGVPFSGSLQAQESSVFQGPPPGTLLVDGSGAGIATDLGRFTLTWHFTVNLADGTGYGPVRFTAANGDEIFTNAAGTSEPTDTPGVFRIVEIQTIIGGTGRFAGAKGSFTVERLEDLNTGFTSGSFHGTITSPGSAKSEQPAIWAANRS